MASTLNNIALIQNQRDKLPQALAHFQKSLSLREEMKDTLSIAASYLNMGQVHMKREAYGTALDQFQKSKEYYSEFGKRQDVLKAINNIALTIRYASDSIVKGRGIQPEKKELKCLALFKKVKREAKRLGIQWGLSTAYINVSESYIRIAQSPDSVRAIYKERKGIRKAPEALKKVLTDSALKYAHRALKLSGQRKNLHGKGDALGLIGEAYFIQERHEKALEHLHPAARLHDSLSLMGNLRESSKLLYETYKALGDHQKALHWHEEHLRAKDSAMNQEKKKKLAVQAARYEFQKEKELRQARHEKELAVAKREERIQRIISYSSGAGLFLVLLFAYFLFDRLKVTRRQKRTIEEQKGLVEEKQKEILSSIDYASHIQNALLKEEEERGSELPEHFIFYRPKEAVSGDFYWSFEKDGDVWFAVADCTGHGVPGAFLTMLGNSFLNEIVPQQKGATPASVLNELRDRFVRELGKRAKDGMDISLLRISSDERTLEWAGANNALYLVRKGKTEDQERVVQDHCKFKEGEDRVLIEFLPDKRPIGKSDEGGDFTLWRTELKGGERLYLFSDGYPDQFGGEKGKKFKYKPFKDLLLSTADRSMGEQRDELERRFEEWKGDLEQVDDVCVAGLKVERG
ncbi:MAG: SpoIIE family protein phosphatase [Flavobacteriales bacterium]